MTEGASTSVSVNSSLTDNVRFSRAPRRQDHQKIAHLRKTQAMPLLPGFNYSQNFCVEFRVQKSHDTTKFNGFTFSDQFNSGKPPISAQ